MKVGHHEETFELFLHAHIIFYGPEIISEVQVSGAADATHHYLITSGILHKQAKIRSWWIILRQWLSYGSN